MRNAFRAHAAVALVLLAGASGCRRDRDRAPASPASGPARIATILSSVPADAGAILYIDFDRMRSQSGAGNLLSRITRVFAPFFENLSAGTGFDPIRDTHRLWLALPALGDGRDGFVLIADADRLDEARLRPWLLSRTGDTLTTFVKDGRRLIIGASVWKNTMLGLLRQGRLEPSAATSGELRRLCERQVDDHGLWLAALLSPQLRQTLAASERFSDAAAIARIGGHVDLDTGFHVDLVAELTNSRDDTSIARRLQLLLSQAKRDPSMLLSGLAPHIDAIHVQAQDATLRVSATLPTSQVADLVERIESVVRGSTDQHRSSLAPPQRGEADTR